MKEKEKTNPQKDRGEVSHSRCEWVLIFLASWSQDVGGYVLGVPPAFILWVKSEKQKLPPDEI